MRWHSSGERVSVVMPAVWCEVRSRNMGFSELFLYSLGSRKFGSRSWCRVLCFPLRSLSAVLCYSSIPSLVPGPGAFRWPCCVRICYCHCWCSGCAGHFVLPAVPARPGSHQPLPLAQVLEFLCSPDDDSRHSERQQVRALQGILLGAPGRARLWNRI